MNRRIRKRVERMDTRCSYPVADLVGEVHELLELLVGQDADLHAAQGHIVQVARQPDGEERLVKGPRHLAEQKHPLKLI